MYKFVYYKFYTSRFNYFFNFNSINYSTISKLITLKKSWKLDFLKNDSTIFCVLINIISLPICHNSFFQEIIVLGHPKEIPTLLLVGTRRLFPIFLIRKNNFGGVVTFIIFVCWKDFQYVKLTLQRNINVIYNHWTYFINIIVRDYRVWTSFWIDILHYFFLWLFFKDKLLNCNFAKKKVKFIDIFNLMKREINQRNGVGFI